MVNCFSNDRLYSPGEAFRPNLHPQNFEFIVHKIMQNLEPDRILYINANPAMINALPIATNDVVAQY